MGTARSAARRQIRTTLERRGKLVSLDAADGPPRGRSDGIRQQVELPVHRVLKYQGSIYARHMSGAPALELSFRRRGHPEEKLASAAVSLNGGEWKRYDFELTLETGILSRLEPADFVIAAMQESRVLLDQVLLFPS